METPVTILKSLLLAAALSLATLSPSQAQQMSAETGAWAATINLDANLNPKARMTPAEEEAFFRNYVIEYNKTWSPGPVARWSISVPAALYQQSNRLFAFDLFPPADGFRGWDSYASEMTGIMNRSREFTVAPDLATFRYARNGNVVWFANAFDAKGVTADGHPYAMRARQTVILELMGERWLVAHEHISVPFSPQPPKQ
jgi:ketosteroid isomerase-like protein